MQQLNSDLSKSKIPTLRGMHKMPLISNKLSGHKSGSSVTNCVVRKLSDKSSSTTTSAQNSSCVDNIVNNRTSETKRPSVMASLSLNKKNTTNQSALPKSKLYKLDKKSSIRQSKPSEKEEAISTTKARPDSMQSNKKASKPISRFGSFLKSEGNKASRSIQSSSVKQAVCKLPSTESNVISEGESLYQKVFLSHGDTKHTMNQTVIRDSNSPTKSIVNQSIDSIKESLTNFRRKFSKTESTQSNDKDSTFCRSNKQSSQTSVAGLSRTQQVKKDSSNHEDYRLLHSEDQLNQSSNHQSVDYNIKPTLSCQTDTLVRKKFGFNQQLSLEFSSTLSTINLDQSCTSSRFESSLKKKNTNQLDSEEEMIDNIKPSRLPKSKTSGQISSMNSSSSSFSLLKRDDNHQQRLEIMKSQQELIEECKNSLNELIKASKWSSNSTETEERRNHDDTCIRNKPMMRKSQTNQTISSLANSGGGDSSHTPILNSLSTATLSRVCENAASTNPANTDFSSCLHLFDKIRKDNKETSSFNDSNRTVVVSSGQQRTRYNRHTTGSVSNLSQVILPSRSRLATTTTHDLNLDTAETSPINGLNIVATSTQQTAQSLSSPPSDHKTNTTSPSSSSYTPLSVSPVATTSQANLFTSCLYIDQQQRSTTNNKYQHTKFENFINNKLTGQQKESIKLKSGDLSTIIKEPSHHTIIDFDDLGGGSTSLSNKRFSTTSEILTKRLINNQDTLLSVKNQPSNITTAPSGVISSLIKEQRKSQPSGILNSTDSLASFKSVPNTKNSMANNQCEDVVGNKSSKTTTTTSQQASKQSEPVKNEKLNATAAANRKSANSWLAQSFRKAFGKIDSGKKGGKSMHKSHYDLNSESLTKSRVVSTLSINNNQDQVYNRNTSHFSDEETEEYAVIKHVGKSGDDVVSNESDNEEKELYANNKNSSLVQTKRSYRSESELTKAGSRQTANEHSNSQVKAKEDKAFKSRIPTNKSKSSSLAAGSKLNKAHKSVSSLLTTSPSNLNEAQAKKLQDINENYLNQSQFSLAAKNKCNCQLNETMIAQLKKKLTTTENNLTDIRLEALSSVHQVDQLKEYLEKLKIDMMSLKSENQLLKKYIKEIKTKRVNRSKLETDDMFMEYLSNDDSSAENQDDTTMIDVCNFSSNYYYSYDFLLDDENESLLRKVLVTLECTYQFSNSGSNNHNLIYEICTINIDSKLKWPLLDGIIAYVFKRYLRRIDETKSLGLDKSSIDKYYVGDLVRRINDSKLPDMLPFGYLVGNNCRIRIVLKDNMEHLDSLCYDTLTPKYLLSDYISMLKTFRFIAISSSQKFGKSFLASKLVQFMYKNFKKEFVVVFFDFEEFLNQNKSESLTGGLGSIRNQLVVEVQSKLMALSKDKSAIVLLENFQSLFSKQEFASLSVDFLNELLYVRKKIDMYLIMTLTDESAAQSLQIPIQFKQSFKWINVGEDKCDFLRAYLLRNLIAYQTSNQKQKDACVIMERVISFMIDLYKQVSDLIARIGFQQHSLNPTSFLNMPFGVESSEKWFVQLWNYTILPYINDMIKIKLVISDGLNLKLSELDLVDWILGHYPWPKNSSNCCIPLNQRLHRLKISDNFFMNSGSLNRIGARSSASSSDSSEDMMVPSIENQQDGGNSNSNQQLASMLLRLQKVANFKSETPPVSNRPYYVDGMFYHGGDATSVQVKGGGSKIESNNIVPVSSSSSTTSSASSKSASNLALNQTETIKPLSSKLSSVMKGKIESAL